MIDEYETYKVVFPNAEKTKTKHLLRIMDLFKTIFNFIKPCPFVHIPGCMYSKNSQNKQRLFLILYH